MVEAVFSILLVSGLVVASMTTLGASAVAQSKFGDQGRGQLLALELLNEILEQSYADPGETVVFGTEVSENAAQRSTFDDVDDYRDYAESPVKYRDGTAISGYAGWTRSVAVDHVAFQDLSLISGSETGVKRITVKVQHGGTVVATMTALKAGN